MSDLGDSVARADAVTARAGGAFQRNDLATARRLNDEACAMYERLGELGKAAAALVRTAQIVRATDGPGAALPFLRDAVALAERGGDLRTLAAMQCRLVRALGDLGQTDEGLAIARDAYLPTTERAGDPSLVAYARTDLARLLATSGDARGALALLVPARAFFKARGDVPAEALALRSIAEAHVALVDVAALTSVLVDELVPIVERIGDAGFTQMTLTWTVALVADLAARDPDVGALVAELRRRLAPT